MMNGFPGKLLAIDGYGNELELQGTISIDEEPGLLSFNEEGSLSDCLITNGSLSVDITNAIKLSRKKFIKLLMSKGIGRNGAFKVAVDRCNIYFQTPAGKDYLEKRKEIEKIGMEMR